MTPAPCECCWVTPVQRSVSDRSPYCPRCRAHLHNLDNLRADHRQLIAAITERQANAVALATNLDVRREQTIKNLMSEREELLNAIAINFLDSPSPALEVLIRDAVVREVEDEARNAYRTRNRAMAAIWRMDELHSETLADKCKCGKPLKGCRDFKELTFFRETYYSWERRQIDLMKQNKRHGLPANHPESRKRYTDAWSWKGEPSTEPDKRR